MLSFINYNDYLQIYYKANDEIYECILKGQKSIDFLHNRENNYQSKFIICKDSLELIDYYTDKDNIIEVDKIKLWLSEKTELELLHEEINNLKKEVQILKTGTDCKIIKIKISNYPFIFTYKMTNVLSLLKIEDIYDNHRIISDERYETRLKNKPLYKIKNNIVIPFSDTCQHSDVEITEEKCCFERNARTIDFSKKWIFVKNHHLCIKLFVGLNHSSPVCVTGYNCSVDNAGSCHYKNKKRDILYDINGTTRSRKGPVIRPHRKKHFLENSFTSEQDKDMIKNVFKEDNALSSEELSNITKEFKCYATKHWPKDDFELIKININKNANYFLSFGEVSIFDGVEVNDHSSKVNKHLL